MSLGKLISVVLGGACLALGLLLTLLLAGVGGGVRPVASSPEALERPLPALDGESPFALREEVAYAVVKDRPLFNEDRRPQVPDDIVGGPEDEENVENLPPTPPPALEVAVKGIIIAPDLRLALVTNPKTSEVLRLREGRPLEGELAAWTLEEIQPRRLVFDGVGAERTEIVLEVNEKALAEAPPVTPRDRTPVTPDAAPQTPSLDGDEAVDLDTADAETRAEEIRRRVAERRAQLREEAARRRAEREEQD